MHITDKCKLSIKHSKLSLHGPRLWRIVLTSISILVCCLASPALDVGINWLQTGNAVGAGYLPRVASDGGNGTTGGQVNTVSIYQDATGFAEFGFQTGFFGGGSTVDWNSTTSIHNEIGHEASIAMASYCVDAECDQSGDAAIEVHQGGQDDGSLLWYRIGQGGVGSVAGSSSGIVWQSKGVSYDHGYNPTIAVDYSGITQPTLVEVHQAGLNFSELWYHVGVYNIGTSSSVSLDGSHNTGFQGYSPTVSISDGLVVLVAQGSGGTLWYSMGAVDTSTGTISWTTPTTYTNGYNPTISVYETGNTFNGDFDVVEAHQENNNATGELFFRTGHMSFTSSGAYPTEIKWTTEDGNTDYANGCYPSVTLFRISGVGAPYVVETHSEACDQVSDIVSDLGIFKFD
jgi:hypothetical protein